METHSLEPLLREHPIFQGLDRAHLDLLVGCASNIRFDPSQPIFKTGEEADRFYILRSGKVAIEIDAPPHGPVIIQTIGEGDVLGWSWLFPPYRRNFDARSIELTRAIALDAKCLRGKCEKDHDLGYELMKRFAVLMLDRLKATRLQLLDLYGSPGGKKR
jgi:CRP/FNR family transcriptional regulator, cyclic AMP receptor protein